MATVIEDPLHALSAEISAERLQSEGFKQVRRVVLKPGVDSTGDQALHIYVLLADSLRDRDLGWDKIRPLAETVRTRALERLPAEVFPYIRVLRPIRGCKSSSVNCAFFAKPASLAGAAVRRRA